MSTETGNRVIHKDFTANILIDNDVEILIKDNVDIFVCNNAHIEVQII